MSTIITPNWPAPNHIKAYSTTRIGGYSQDNYACFNLAMHVGDDPNRVSQNRNLLRQKLNLYSEPFWLNQVHGQQIITAEEYKDNIEADGCYAFKPNQICVIMTADCLPILITNAQGNFVMALHGGWKGIADGIIEKGITIAKQFGDEIMVWLGPAIGKAVYEIGDEVKTIFVNNDPVSKVAFTPSKNQRWLMDIYTIARLRLANLGINNIFTDEFCTYQHKEQFFSYRREGKTGRMASLVYMC